MIKPCLLLPVCLFNPATFTPFQGALDGGLNIPHNEKRFVGWTKEEGLEAEVRVA
jgi:hypothetical protein